MTAYGHEYSQHGSRQQPPFLPSLIESQPQDEEENTDSAHVHRSRGKRLRPPVQRQLRHVFLSVFLEQFGRLRLLGIYSLCRCPSVKIRNHHIGKFFPAITPGGGVIQIQSLGGAAVPGQLRPATHGFRGVLGQRQQFVHIGGNPRQAQHQQQGRCRQEPPPSPVPNHMHQLCHGVQQHHNGQIVSDLLMIGLHLHTQGQAKERRPQEGPKEIPGQAGDDGACHGRLRPAICMPVGIHQRGQNPGHEGYGLHLGVVAYLDNLEIIAAEGYGYGAAYGQRPADTKGQKQQKSPQQRHKQVSSRSFARKKKVIQHLRVIAVVSRGNGSCGHSAKHGIGPIGGIVRMLFVPAFHLMRHAHVTGDVALVHNLSVQHLGYKTVAERQEKGQDTEGDTYLFK